VLIVSEQPVLQTNNAFVQREDFQGTTDGTDFHGSKKQFIGICVSPQ